MPKKRDATSASERQNTAHSAKRKKNSKKKDEQIPDAKAVTKKGAKALTKKGAKAVTKKGAKAVTKKGAKALAKDKTHENPTDKAQSEEDENFLSDEEDSEDGYDIIVDLPIELEKILLAEIEAANQFCSYGQCASVPNPAIEVKGFGTLELPLVNPERVQRLLEVCTKAPYGKKEQTLLDDTVRKTFQIQPEQLEMKNKSFMRKLNQDVKPLLVQGWGLTTELASKVKFELYKLLVYTPGCMFKPHKDTEKNPKMFATLVVVLPSVYTGGELVLKHREEVVTVDLAAHYNITNFCGFFSDVEHEIKPIHTGVRLALVFNVNFSGNRKGHPKMLQAPTNKENYSTLSRFFRSWIHAVEDYSKFVACVFKYEYTVSGLQHEKWKGSDGKMVDFVIHSVEKSEQDFLIFVALVKKTKSGHLNNEEVYDIRYSDCEGEGDEGSESSGFETDDTMISLKNLQFLECTSRLDPTVVDNFIANIPVGHSLSIDDDDVIKMGRSWEDFYSDESVEFTGNEGATKEIWYETGALVLVPWANRLSLLHG